jgi:hypothetical protein
MQLNWAACFNFFKLLTILHPKLLYMSHLILSAFYDNVNKNVGPTLMWVFFLLSIIQWVYVMVKYLNSEDSKK